MYWSCWPHRGQARFHSVGGCLLYCIRSDPCGSGLAREEAGTANQFLTDRHIYVHLRQTIFLQRPILVLYCLKQPEKAPALLYGISLARCPVRFRLAGGTPCRFMSHCTTSRTTATTAPSNSARRSCACARRPIAARGSSLIR
ncbi:hypothetical protein EMIT0P176_30040 [Pseudomonas sp. IT-P176]